MQHSVGMGDKLKKFHILIYNIEQADATDGTVWWCWFVCYSGFGWSIIRSGTINTARRRQQLCRNAVTCSVNCWSWIVWHLFHWMSHGRMMLSTCLMLVLNFTLWLTVPLNSLFRLPRAVAIFSLLYEEVKSIFRQNLPEQWIAVECLGWQFY